jgi:hypothetical protein
VFKKVEPVHRPPFNPVDQLLQPQQADAASATAGNNAAAAGAASGTAAAGGAAATAAATATATAAAAAAAAAATALAGPDRIEDRYLFCADDGRWWVGDEEDIRTGASVGWLVTSRCCALPADGTSVGWEVWQEGRTFAADPDLVCVVSPGLVQRLRREAHEREAREAKRVEKLMAKGGLKLVGHTGRYSILMGYYATLPTKMVNDALVFEQQANGEPKRYLCVFVVAVLLLLLLLLVLLLLLLLL